MAIRLTPHLLSAIDWNNPLDDPIRRQFLPLASGVVPDHEGLKLDSLNEQDDSRMLCMSKFRQIDWRPTAVPGLVHRYPGRALFLGMFPYFCHSSWITIMHRCVASHTNTFQQLPFAQCIAGSVPVHTPLEPTRKLSRRPLRNQVVSAGKLSFSISRILQVSMTLLSQVVTLIICSLRTSKRLANGTSYSEWCHIFSDNRQIT